MKLLVFDVEGTIFKADYKIEGTEYASTMWQPIAHSLGEEAIVEELETHSKWAGQEYNNYIHWVEDSIKIHQKYSLKEEVFNDLIIKAEYNEGVVEFFKNLDREKYIPVLISGGFQNLIRRAEQELDIKYGFGACEYYFDEEGYLDHYNLQLTDFGGKYNFIKLMFNQFGVNSKEDWIFIGDGKNDIDIAKRAPLSFAINPHPELLKVDGIIEIDSFEEIIPAIDIYYDKGNKADKKDVKESEAKESKNEDIGTEVDEVGVLKKRIYDQDLEIKKLKQENNDLKGRNNSKTKSEQVKVTDLDYQSTPIYQLKDFLSKYNVVFLGLKKEYANFLYLDKYHKNLRVIQGTKNNFDTSSVENADFLFIYKDCISHTAVKHAFTVATPPYAFLKSSSNKYSIENAMANVLYRACCEKTIV